MRDIASEEGNISLEAKTTFATVEEIDDTDDIILADICEVVISLKCKQCQFLCNDKSTLAGHIRQVHSKRPVPVRQPTVNEDTKNAGTKTEIVCSVDTNQGNGKSDKNDLSKAESPSKTGIHSEPSSSSAGDKNGSTPGSLETSLDESVEDVFLCAECDIVFSSREMCCSHMNKVHGLKQFSADFIQEEIISKPNNEEQNAKKGRKTKLPKQFGSDSGSVVPKKFRVSKDVFHMCSKCSLRFASLEVMKFHEQCHHVAPHGDEKTSQKRSKKKHSSESLESSTSGESSEVLPVKGFTCPVCDSNGADPQVFPKWGPCSWHLWKEHRIDCELYTCSVCKQFKSHLIARVKDHEQLHSTKASYKCKTCNKSFKQMKQLRCHEKYHKDNSTKLAPEVDSRWYTPKECPICKRILSDSKCLKKHISAVHNKLKPYVCQICGHTSARKAELKLHVRQHTGEKPYKCPMCPFQTGDHNSLRKHKLRHSDERPYACSYCDYRCIQSCAFKKHILACHPGQEVVFVCQLCSHASVNETMFAAHQKDHAEGRINVESSNDSEDATDEKRSSSPISSTGSPQAQTVRKYWSGDDDSLDIIDNGGVTIPASPPSVEAIPPSPATDNKSSEKPAFTRKPGKVARTTVTRDNMGTSSRASEPILPTKSQGIPGRSGKSQIPILNGKSPDRPQFLVPKGFCLSSHSLASPRVEKAPCPVGTTISSAGVSATTTSEDTESSTSEMITNPHQLIQNIQLTPLDLTDIIYEQSNDDGMLQRLLDMSGV